MISYKANHVALHNLHVTFGAITELDRGIKFIRTNTASAPIAIKVPYSSISTQIDRDLMIETLLAQRKRLVEYLAGVGVDYDIHSDEPVVETNEGGKCEALHVQC